MCCKCFAPALVSEKLSDTRELKFHLTKGTAAIFKDDIDKIAAPTDAGSPSSSELPTYAQVVGAVDRNKAPGDYALAAGLRVATGAALAGAQGQVHCSRFAPPSQGPKFQNRPAWGVGDLGVGVIDPTAHHQLKHACPTLREESGLAGFFADAPGPTA